MYINWGSYWNVKTWNKKIIEFFWALLASVVASIVQPIISAVVKDVSGRGVRRAERGYMDTFFLIPLHSWSNIKITGYFNYKPRFNGFFKK